MHDLTEYLVMDSSNHGQPVQPVAIEVDATPVALYWFRENGNDCHTVAELIEVEMFTPDFDDRSNDVGQEIALDVFNSVQFSCN